MRIAVLGDLHGRFDADDARWLDAEGYDAVLVVGDLGEGSTTWAAALASLRTPTFVVPGNHDGLTLPQLGAEITGQRWLADRLAHGMEARVEALAAALRPARLSGYARHDLGEVQLVVGRPHTQGGPELTCRAWLERSQGVADLQASAARLTELLLACDERPVVVLAHNGPAGLGGARTDPFGRDFHPDQGDWGDPDLAVALDAAAAAGKRVVAVVAGHMHHRLSGGGQRRTWGLRAGVLVVNAARVPRIERAGARHHVELVVDEGAQAFAVVVHEGRAERTPLGA